MGAGLVRRFREPIYDTVSMMLDTYWRPGLSVDEKADILRTVIDTVQSGVGNRLLRDLHRTRAYHTRSGELGPDELLHAQAVMSLIREATGMAAEPGEPVARETQRHRGLRGRLGR
jgi:hypothetical protein